MLPPFCTALRWISPPTTNTFGRTNVFIGWKAILSLLPAWCPNQYHIGHFWQSSWGCTWAVQWPRVVSDCLLFMQTPTGGDLVQRVRPRVIGRVYCPSVTFIGLSKVGCFMFTFAFIPEHLLQIFDMHRQDSQCLFPSPNPHPWCDTLMKLKRQKKNVKKIYARVSGGWGNKSTRWKIVTEIN